MNEEREIERLRHELEQSQAIARSIGDGVYVLDRGGRLLSLNNAAERLLGWRAEELRGRSMHNAIHAVDAAGNPVDEKDCPLIHVLESGTPVRLDSDVFIRKDGGKLPVGYISSPVMRDGRVDGAVLVFREIGAALERDRSQAEALELQAQALRDAEQSERQYRALADFIPQQVWTAKPDGTLDYVNQQSLVYFGRTFDEMIGLGWQDVIHNDDLPGCLERWTNSLSTGEPYEVQFRLLRCDGDYRWHLGRAIPVRDESGIVTRWLGTNTDVDAQTLARDREKILAEASRVLGSSLNYEETLDRVAAATVPGFAEGAFVHLLDESGTLAVRSIHHHDERKLAALRSITDEYPATAVEPYGPSHVVSTGQPEMIADLDSSLLRQFAHDEAHLRNIEQLDLRSFISVPLTSREKTLGAITFVVSRGRPAFDGESLKLATRIGERASLAIENVLLYRRAEEASRAKDDFLATLSHELRTPLTAMLGWARMMKLADLDPASTQEAIHAIERSALAQSELIEDVLDISRVTSGKLSLNLEEVELQEVTLAAIETLKPSASLRAVTLESVCQSEPIRVMADPRRLQQIVWNLLSNAIKFTPNGGRVTIECESRENQAILGVRDDGRGMSPELLPHIFEAFRQEDSSTTRSSSGLGLGLAIVRSLVELHGGTIRAESEGLGRGSLFTVSLPIQASLVRPSSTREAVAARASKVETRRLPSLSGVDVLIVDDNVESMGFISALMTRCGALVRTAHHVDAALALIEERRPMVLVSDIAMPGRDGYSLIREITSRGGVPIPSLALTAFGQPSDREQVFAAGFHRYLKKPVEPLDLAESVAELAAQSKRS